MIGMVGFFYVLLKRGTYYAGVKIFSKAIVIQQLPVFKRLFFAFVRKFIANRPRKISRFKM